MSKLLKPTALLVIIIILIMSNIALGAAWWYSNKHADDRKRMERPSQMGAYLKDELKFSAQQQVLFDSLRLQNRREGKEMMAIMRKLKQDAYKKLGASHFSDTAILTAIDFAAQQQKGLEANMIFTLQEIRKICTDEQRAKFDSGFYKAFIRNEKEKK